MIDIHAEEKTRGLAVVLVKFAVDEEGDSKYIEAFISSRQAAGTRGKGFEV